MIKMPLVPVFTYRTTLYNQSVIVKVYPYFPPSTASFASLKHTAICLPIFE